MRINLSTGTVLEVELLLRVLRVNQDVRLWLCSNALLALIASARKYYW